MRIKYFADTDTALLEFYDKDVADTISVGENIILHLDASGNLVTMTIEHAKQQAGFPFLSFEQIEKNLPDQSLTDTIRSR